MAGQRAAVAALVGYALTGIERGEEWSGAIPSPVVAQVHRAARNGVGLETVLPGYAAGNRLLLRFMMAEADGLPIEALGRVLDTQGSLLERLMAEVSVEHKREAERGGRSVEQRRIELVRKLLAGEPADAAELGYELGVWHLGVIATGVGSRDALRSVAAHADRRLLPVSPGEETVWAWLGGQRKVTVAKIDRLVETKGLEGVSLAIGEPGRGIDGWRLTHQQAQAARLVALERPPRRITRYAEEMLVAPAVRDETLARSLKELYLLPLATQRDGGAASRETLRAYFKAERNATAAGARLGVARQTVEQRLQTIEQVLGRRLASCLTELEVALRLEELGSATDREKKHHPC